MYDKKFHLVVISNPHTPQTDEELHSEISVVNQLFEAGLETFHLRKPKITKRRMKKYLEHIPRHFLNRVIIHSHHFLIFKYKLKGIHLKRRHREQKISTWLKIIGLRIIYPKAYITTSFHSLASIYENTLKVNYAFLSPVFDSISKQGYSAAFSSRSLKESLKFSKTHIYALGGVDVNTIEQAIETGFAGAAVLGTIWDDKEDKISNFVSIKNKCSLQESSYKQIQITPVKITMNY